MEDADAPEGEESNNHNNRRQDVTRAKVRGNILQVYIENVRVGPVVGVVLVVAIVLSGAVYLRSLRISNASDSQGNPPTSGVQSPVSGQMATATNSAPTEAVLRVTTDSNPFHLSSDALVELHGQSQDWMIPKENKVYGIPDFRQEADALYNIAAKYDGVSVNNLFFSATVQNLTGGAVQLRSMQVDGLSCTGPMKGTRITAGGGADYKPPNVVFIDLDVPSPRPLLLPKAPSGFLDPRTYPGGLARLAKQAKPFGFTLPKEGSEAFDFAVTMRRHQHCSFRLIIQAVVNGEHRQLPITREDGKPFQIAGDPDREVWFYTPGASGMEAWRQGENIDPDARAIVSSNDVPLGLTDP